MAINGKKRMNRTNRLTDCGSGKRHGKNEIETILSLRI